MKSTILHLLFVLLGCQLAAQQATFTIGRLSTPPVMDGELSEPVWESAQTIKKFTTTLPQPGKTPQQATEVKMGFTNFGVYIAAICMSDHIRDDGNVKDENGTGDYFSVGFDTWNDDQNAFVFTLTAGGQLNEQRITSNLTEPGYNCSWHARTHLEADRWTLEMFIPFSSLRFPTGKIQEWGLQFTRYDRHSGEMSTWSPQDPLVQDVVLQYGQMEGLTIMKKVRPMGYSAWGKYESLYRDNYGKTSSGTYFNGQSFGFYPGMDGRFGINQAAVFDFSVFPVIKFIFHTNSKVDPPHHLESEPRQFFSNESGIFSKTLPQLKTPDFSGQHLKAMVRESPSNIFVDQEKDLINNTKFTYRTRNGIGIGFGNSLYSGFAYGSSYPGYQKGHSFKLPVVNQIAIDKTFRNNSWVQISNIHYAVGDHVSDNMAAVGGQWRDRTNRFELAGQLNVHAITRRYSKASGNISMQKVNGAWRWGATYTSPQTPGMAFFSDSTFSIEQLTRHTVTTHFGWYNYHPASTRFLQTAIVFKNLEQKEMSKEQWLLWRNEIIASALLKNFQRVTARITTFQTSLEEKLVFPEQTYFRKTPFFTQLLLNWLSDERKKFIFGTNAGITQRWGVREPGVQIGTYWQWVPSPQFILRYRNIFEINRNKTKVRSEFYSVGAVQIYDEKAFHQSFGCLFSPSPKFTFSLDWMLVKRFRSNSNLYLLNDATGTLSGLSAFVAPYKEWMRSPAISAAFNFTPNRQLRFQWQKSRDFLYDNTTGYHSDRDIRSKIFSLQIIWGFYK